MWLPNQIYGVTDKIIYASVFNLLEQNMLPDSGLNILFLL
jgi:hypothetical protein